MSDLRGDFFEIMRGIAWKNKDIVLLVGDLGYSFMEEFQEEFPEQFINCGIAEQNMVGVAAGLARAGKIPFVYSNSIFLLGRAFEQVRDDVAYPSLDVKLVGTGASGFLGYTHNWGKNESPEHIVKTLPNITFEKPTNPVILKTLLYSMGPLYIQL